MIDKVRTWARILKMAKRSAFPLITRERLMSDERADFKKKLEYDAFARPHFAYGIYFAALQAKALGIKGISVYEFGVGWGGGLLEMEKVAEMVTHGDSGNISACGCLWF